MTVSASRFKFKVGWQIITSDEILNVKYEINNNFDIVTRVASYVLALLYLTTDIRDV